MPKIKDIRERIQKNPTEYLEMKLIVAKRALALFFLLYYGALLFTIGGFSLPFISLDVLSAFTFHLYTILMIVMAWFIFSLAEYAQHIYYPDKSWLKFVGIVFAFIFAGFTLVAHMSGTFL